MFLFRRFRKNQQGSFAVVFALLLIPLLGVVGVAIDYSRAFEMRLKLADALDAGVLAVGAQPNISQAAAFKIINDWIVAQLGDQYPEHWQLDSVTLGNDGIVNASASGTVNTTLARIVGVTQMPITVTTQAIRSLGKVEVVLVLDNTGSMKGSKLTKLKGAAKSLVDDLVNATKDPNDLKIALVPFSQTVNVGSQYQNASWMDNQAESSIHDDIFTKANGGVYPGTNRFTLFSAMNVGWGGCVESRPYPYDVTEAPPTDATPDTLYVPYFAPDEPDSRRKSRRKNRNFGTFYNDYLTDKKYSRSDWKIPQGYPDKYSGQTPRTGTSPSGYIYGPNAGCEIAPLQRLTTNSNDVKSAINAMTAVGDTNIPFGLAWGQHVLSPKAPFGDGVEYESDEWIKVVVLMTDGNNRNTTTGNRNDSYYSGVGYIWQDRLGVGAGSSISKRTSVMDGRLTELCTDVKQKNIEIYTVRVEVNSGSSAALRGCASETGMFYEVQDVADLGNVFAKIGGSIQTLRLTK